MSDENILKEDLNALALAKAVAQAKVLDGQKSELEYRNYVLSLFLKYKLSLEDSFDETSGEIKRKPVEEVKSVE